MALMQSKPQTFSTRRNGNTLIVFDDSPTHEDAISRFIEEVLSHWKLHTKSKSVFEGLMLKQNIWIFVKR